MNLAINLDVTSTRDPALRDALLAAGAARGHRIFRESARHPRQMEGVCDMIGQEIGAEARFGTAGAPKRRYMAEVVDTHVDVWIDDAPESVIEIPLLPGPDPSPSDAQAGISILGGARARARAACVSGTG